MNQTMTNHASSAYVEHCVLRVRKLNIMNEGHRNVDARYLTSALNYLDSPPDIRPETQAACEQRFTARRDEAVAAVRTALAADDRDKAKAALAELQMTYGPLAEPDFSRLSACADGEAVPHTCAAGTP